MQRLQRLFAHAVILFALGRSPLASAAEPPLEEKFQDLFVTAGYCTAFGAALGTAFLAWTDDPAANLKYVAMGASLGFLGGSVLGTYIIFSPGVAMDAAPADGQLLSQVAIPDHGLVVRPVFREHTWQLQSLEAGTTLARF